MSSKAEDQVQGFLCLACIALITSVVFPPIILLWIVAVIYWIYSYAQRQQQIASSGIADIDRMSGHQFEDYLVLVFKKAGYYVQHTPYSGDFGADHILTHNGTRTVVQAKCYSGTVGVKAVQEIAAARGHYGASGAMVITNSYFTPQAVALARSNGVQLWDRDALITFINRVHGQ